MRKLFFFLGLAFVHTAAAQDFVLGRSSDPNVHDPVMARENGKYYIFSTGMGIDVLSSDDMKNWTREAPVFKFVAKHEDPPAPGEHRRRDFVMDREKSTIPQWAIDTVKGYRGHTWAPDISRHNGLWHLYYSCSTFGKNRSAIGLAVNKTLDHSSPDFKWEDRGMVIASHQHQDNWNAIDPNLIVGKKQQPWLVYGSFWDGIQIVRLDKRDFQTPVTAPKTIARRMGRKLTLADIDKVENFTVEGGDTIEAGENAVEAPFIIRRGKYYYLFVSFDYCCRGQNSTYKTVYGRSKKVDGPYYDKEGRPMAKGGGTYLYGPDADNFGIGHCSAYEFDNQWYFVSHAYRKDANGGAKLFVKKIKFDKKGWIVRE
ncbi:MAG: family 43 glycosylhydrolase [Bacteroidaceae bacterium]|nr:family 43 glycosylhydrolase [Bacteroidaceae bacterium]